MKLTQVIKRKMPFLMRWNVSLQKKQLMSNPRVECKVDNLLGINALSLNDIFNSHDIEIIWLESIKCINQLAIPDGTGGVNPGDRRAIFYLICALKPLSVLEIGSYIGASTIHIAAALYQSHIRNGNNAKLNTVDITDVNSPIEKPWLKHGTAHSPIEMIEKLGYESFVKFTTDTSLHYAANCTQRFDFIFLDGDHSGKAVYQEIPVSLDLLNQNGVILLHDYFPEMKPLWSDGSVIPGPFLATERFQEEGANVSVLPLGKLPWPTKLHSNVTSLALLMKN
jgi:predicted O-methyltransferase YrrM